MTVPLLWIAYMFSFTMYVLMKMFIAIGNKKLTVEKANLFNTFLIPTYIVPISMFILTLLFKDKFFVVMNLIFAFLMALVVLNDLFGDIKRKSITVQTGIALVFTLIVAVVLLYFSIVQLKLK